MIPIILLYLLRVCWCMPEVSYVVNMNSQVECCDEDSKNVVDVSGVVVARYNETIAYMSGNIKFLKDIGEENVMAELILEKEANGKFELMFSHEICDLCAEVTKGDESDYYPYMKYFGIPEECPFLADVYPIKNFIVDTDDMPVNSNTVGQYQAYVYLYKNPEKDCKSNKELMCCLTIKLIVEMD